MRRDAGLILLVIVAASAFLSPGRRGLFPGDEREYFRVVSEMRAHDAVLVPTLDGRPYGEKPPFHFWIVYGLTHLFGIESTWPFVLPSLLTFIAMIFLIRRMSIELFGGDGFLAPLIFATFSLAWGLGQSARMDMMFTLMITAAVRYVHRWLREGSSRSLVFAGFSTGVAILVKGPMAFVIVALVLIVYRFLQPHDPGARVPIAPYPVAVCVAVAIPLAWLIPAIRAGGPQYAHELLVRQTAGRAIDAWVHAQPPWWYVLRFPTTFFPWFALAAIAIAGLRGSRGEERFCLTWFLCVFVPFSLISGKLDVYMLPAMVPLALLCARFVESAPPNRWPVIGAWANSLLMAAFALLGAFVPLVSPLTRSYLPQIAALPRPLLIGLQWSTAAVATAALAWIFASWRREGRLLRTVIAVVAVTMWPQIYFTLFLLPLLNKLASA